MLTLFSVLAFHLWIGCKTAEGWKEWTVSGLFLLFVPSGPGPRPGPQSWRSIFLFFFIKNITFSKLSHILSEILINATVAHTTPEPLPNRLALPRKTALPASPQQERSSGWNSHSMPGSHILGRLGNSYRPRCALSVVNTWRSQIAATWGRGKLKLKIQLTKTQELDWEHVQPERLRILCN